MTQAPRLAEQFVAAMRGLGCVETVRVALIDELHQCGYDGAS